MRCQLLAWFAEHCRVLPWREKPTPYPVLVSEIMAQQTRIAQLLPFYVRFMERFPTLEALARADEADVLAVWAGMGYYARARNLHRTAQLLCEMPDWPTTRAAWEALPGIGAYTAGAVLSIAFGQKAAAIDGNVLRVYSRLACDATDIATPIAKKNAEAYVLAHMPDAPEEVRAFSQALMELGALVCTPTNPRCGECPLAEVCEARKVGRVQELPVKAKKKASPIVPITVLLFFSPDGKVMMRRRDAGLLRGMMVYWLVEGEQLVADAVAGYVGERGFTVRGMEALGDFSHTFTHRVWQMTGYAVQVGKCAALDGYEWLTPDEVAARGLPAAMRYF